MHNLTAEQIIQTLQLEQHPEGGYFRETYRSSEHFKPNYHSNAFPSDRPYSTAIYYLLKKDQMSKFHRIRSDEIWHFHAGSPATIHIIHPDSLYEARYLGPDIQNGQYFQHAVPAQSWFGVTIDESGSFMLASCTVSPGFDFKDFEMADAYRLRQAFPEHRAIIEKLT